MPVLDIANLPPLKPIGGRVSRAKKGVPVHVCELCTPSKVTKTLSRREYPGQLIETTRLSQGLSISGKSFHWAGGRHKLLTYFSVGISYPINQQPSYVHSLVVIRPSTGRNSSIGTYNDSE
jgi:hypothetical protein